MQFARVPCMMQRSQVPSLHFFRAPRDHIIGILISYMPSSWALEPECKILHALVVLRPLTLLVDDILQLKEAWKTLSRLALGALNLTTWIPIVRHSNGPKHPKGAQKASTIQTCRVQVEPKLIGAYV